jgi:hypothetical protein
MSDDATDNCTDTSTFAEITVKGPGVSITRPVDEVTMSKVIALLFGAAPTGGSGRPGAGGPGGATGSATGESGGSEWDDNLTLGEFIVETSPQTFPQKICAAGYYLTDVKGAASFSKDEVRAALADAREDMPANFTRDFNDAAAKSFVASKQGEAGRYIIPKTGRTAVLSHFQDVPKRRPARKTAKKTSSKSDSGT